MEENLSNETESASGAQEDFHTPRKPFVKEEENRNG